ncbi:hypothetical protein JCM19000A_09340 [Silvimonas sp. JCM 19000]
MNTSRLYLLQRMLAIVWPFMLIVLVLVMLQWACLDLLAAGRAYVGGESMWSKGQKDAAYYLARYIDHGEVRDYRAYEAAVAIPLADQHARLELEMPVPDRAAIRAFLLRGGNDSADIAGMIRLYLNFKWAPDIAAAIDVWQRADLQINRLQQLAAHARQLRERDHLTEADLDSLRQQIRIINASLTPLEAEFSQRLSHASRKMEIGLATGFTVAAILLIALALRRTFKLVRQRELSDAALRHSEQRFQLAVNGSNDGIWDWDMTTDHVWYSPRFRQLLGVNKHELAETPEAWFARVHPDDQALIAVARSKQFRNGQAHDVEYRVLTGHNGYHWFRVRGRAAFDLQGKPVRMAGSITDVTDRKAAEQALQLEKEKAEITLASIADAVITTDILGRIQYLNPAAERLLSIARDSASGRNLDDICQLVDQAQHALSLLADDANLPDTLDPNLRDFRLLRHDGVEVSVDRAIAPLRGRGGEVIGIVLVLHDATRERQYAANLSWQASHDALTGLVNRREFERRLAQLYNRTQQRSAQHALMFLDLDQFKIVNDTCGHAAGDELLRQLAGVLQQHLRQTDTLARIGGDEFGVLLENCAPEQALRIAETLRQSVRDFHFAFGSQSFTVGASIGMVHLGDNTMALQELLRAADAACYMAKEKGRNRVQQYSPQDHEVTLRHGEMEWVQRLKHALQADRFRLYAQEIVGLSSASFGQRHVEVLLRLLDEHDQIVPPMAFIPAAERYNLMPEIDRWVLQNTLQTLAAREAAGLPPLALCAINLSGASVGDEHFLQFALEHIRSSGIDPARLCFEITETTAVASLTRATRFMQELSGLGCCFALDDFGAGMSSFGYLKHLPVQYLKIDGGFVKDMLNDPIDRAMVSAINEIGHLMGKQTVAEFVENQAIADALRQLGVDYAQGYGLARPEPFRLMNRDIPDARYA